MDRELPVSPWQEWQIVEKIGEGSYGRVYKAQRSEHGHVFFSAVKIVSIPSSREEWNSVLSETQDSEAARAYFENVLEECIQEICTMEEFHGNSHIVSVEDFKVVEYLDEVGWDLYIRMEYLTSFLDYCEGRSFGEKEVLRLGVDLCRALCYCRKQKILHRDIKPENIFVSRFGDYKLGDFGTARKMQKDTDNFSKKGTYSYMAPELYRGETYDDGADIYALGLVLYKLLNHNRLPFLSLEKQLITYRDKEQALNRRMSGEELPDPADASPELAAILKKACAYHRAERYASAAEFLRDLEQLRAQRRRTSGARSETGKTRQRSTTEKKNAITEKKNVKKRQDSTVQGGAGAKNKRAEFKKRRAVDQKNRDVTVDTELVRNVAPWIIAIILVAMTAVVGTGLFMKKMLEDTVAQQSQQMVTQIQDKSAGLSEEDTGFADALEQIGERVTTIVEEITEYQEVGTAEKLLRYLDENGEVRKVLVYPSQSSENVYEEYYYWNNTLIFAYIWKGDDVDMFYYQDGILIRWVDKNGEIYDNEQENEEYLELGDRYWNHSVQYLEG